MEKKTGRNVLREETYHNGLLHGISRVYTIDGELLFQTFFNNGTGYYKDYFNDKKQVFIEGELVNGKRNGIWKTYFKSGLIKYEENYKNDLLHGNYTSYNESGEILYTSKFENGTGYYKCFDITTKKLLEEGEIEEGYRVNKWVKMSYFTHLGEDREREEIVVQTKNSPENRRLSHNVIEIVYVNGQVYYVTASDDKKIYIFLSSSGTVHYI